MRTIVVGSRRSELALTQTKQVIEQLKKASEKMGKPYQFKIKEIVTKGDQILDVMLSKVGGKGLFVKEIEHALAQGEIDMAVHSMKDMPAQLLPGLVNGAITEREDPRDCLISKHNGGLDGLPEGALVGTSSLRRSCQIRRYRPDLQVKFVRGNIGTRIDKLQTEGFDAVILATAGLKRVGWEERISEILDPSISLPAVGQGALGIECRQNDEDLLALLSHINHEETAAAVQAERTFLARMDGSCQVPIGGFAVLENGTEDSGPRKISLTAMVGSADGAVMLKETMTGTDSAELGERMADLLIEQGARDILEQAGRE